MDDISKIKTLDGNTYDIKDSVARSNSCTNVGYDTTNKVITKTINGTTTSIVSAETLRSDMSIDECVTQITENDVKLIQEKAPAPVNFSTAALASLLDYHMSKAHD